MRKVLIARDPTLLRFNFIPVIGCQQWQGEEDWELRDQLGMRWAETWEQSAAINLSSYKYVNTPVPLKLYTHWISSWLRSSANKNTTITLIINNE